MAPPPLLEGFESLFHPPLSLREIHCFSPSRTGWEEEEDQEVVVLMCEVHLGGRVGDACIAAGGSSSYTVGALEVLLENTKVLLRTTSENGLQLVLDALCTRSPVRMDIGSYLLEPDDGVSLMRKERAVAEMMLTSSSIWCSASPIGGNAILSQKKSNRRFIQNMLSPLSVQDRNPTCCSGGPGSRNGVDKGPELPSDNTLSLEGRTDGGLASPGSASYSSHTVVPSPLLSPNSLPKEPPEVGLSSSGPTFPTAKPAYPSPSSFTPRELIASTVKEKDAQGNRIANFLSKALTFQVHYLRRRALLYFLQWDMVPLSLLSSRVRESEGKKVFVPPFSINPAMVTTVPNRGGGGGKRRSSSRGLSQLFHPGEDLTPLVGLPSFPVGAVLRRSKRLQDVKSPKTVLWRKLTETSEELGSLLVLAVQRTLCCCFPHHTEFFGKEMWCKPHRATVHTPLFAAYSASGLLLGSGTFYHVLQHRERYILSAVAMNALATAPLSCPYKFASTGERMAGSPAPLDWKLDVQQFPLAVNHPTAGADTIDFCIWRVGDALAVVVGLSRMIQKQRGIPLQTLGEFLTHPKHAPANGLACITPSFSSCAGSAFLGMLSYALHVLCHHNLSPTQEYYAAVCSLSALERGIFFDSHYEELKIRGSLRDTLEKSGASYYYGATNPPSFSVPGAGAGVRETTAIPGTQGRVSAYGNAPFSSSAEGFSSSSADDSSPIRSVHPSPPVMRLLEVKGMETGEEIGETEVECVGCLPFSRRRRASTTKQEMFMTERVKMGQQKIAYAQAQLETVGSIQERDTSFLGRSGTVRLPTSSSPLSLPLPASSSSCGSSSSANTALVPVSRVKLQFIRSLLLLYLSPSAMWYYAASRASMAEGLTFRSLEGTGVHSAFWLQQVEKEYSAETDGGRPTVGVVDSGRWSNSSSSISENRVRNGNQAKSTSSHSNLITTTKSRDAEMTLAARSKYCVGFFRPRVEHSVQEGAMLWLQNPGKTLEWAMGGVVSSPSSFSEINRQTSVTVLPVAALEEVASSPLHGWMESSSSASHSPALLQNEGIMEISACTPILIGEEVEPVEEVEGNCTNYNSGQGLLSSLHVTSQQVLRVKKYKRSSKKNVHAKVGSIVTVGEEEAGEEDLYDEVLGEMGDDEEENMEMNRKENGSDTYPGERSKRKEKIKPTSTSSIKIQIAEVMNLENDWRGEENNLLRVLEKQSLPKAFSTRREPDLFDPPKCEDWVRDLCEELLLCKEAVTAVFHGALVH